MSVRYSKFLKGLQLQYFSPEELIVQGSRTRTVQRYDGPGGTVIIKNELPPDHLWSNIVPTLWILDLARHRLGKPLSITSAYRSEEYNEAVGGAEYSQHKVNNAIDVIPGGGITPKGLFDLLLDIRRGRAFKGGLGLYNSFVHIDTRGKHATWGTR